MIYPDSDKYLFPDSNKHLFNCVGNFIVQMQKFYQDMHDKLQFEEHERAQAEIARDISGFKASFFSNVVQSMRAFSEEMGEMSISPISESTSELMSRHDKLLDEFREIQTAMAILDNRQKNLAP
jgi:hypothetical protein